MALKEKAQCEPIARTGRVQDWLDSPESRLPVSCTVFNVEDSMEGDDGIEASWRFVSHGLRNGAGVAIHLSSLRERNAENGKGLVASGPVSFGKIYSTLNEILRRGGVYKNGAVVLHLDYDHPDALEFINASRSELPWVKRCINVDEKFIENLSLIHI
jgi:ribonucleotide reductase alpha subunit